MLYWFCWHVDFFSSSLRKHAHGQRWLADDKMQGTLDLYREIRAGMTWGYRHSRNALQPENVNSPNKTWSIWLRDQLSLRLMIHHGDTTYWFLVSQYVNMRPVLKGIHDASKLDVQLNCFCQILCCFSLCDIFVGKALSGNCLYRAGSEAVNHSTLYI